MTFGWRLITLLLRGLVCSFPKRAKWFAIINLYCKAKAFFKRKNKSKQHLWNKEPDRENFSWKRDFSHVGQWQVKNAHERTCRKTKVYIYLYISPYENLFENGCIYISIYSRIFENIPENAPEYSHRKLAIASFLVCPAWSHCQVQSLS